MNEDTRVRILRIALILTGLIFIFGVYPLMMYLWPSGWRWQPNQPQYEQMIMGVYATLGVFLLMASRNPLQHRSLIWFTAWSSLVRGHHGCPGLSGALRTRPFFRRYPRSGHCWYPAGRAHSPGSGRPQRSENRSLSCLSEPTWWMISIPLPHRWASDSATDLFPRS